MKGLRTVEDPRFVSFFQEIQKEARKQKSVFFLDFGDCLDEPFNDMVIDKLAGWLIPEGKSKDFETVFLNKLNTDDWLDFYTWCIPEIKENKLEITFRS